MHDYLVQWPALLPGHLIRRYKRFMADVELSDGTTVTVHCPNSGRMTGCGDSGSRVYLSRSDNPVRKYAYTWEMTDLGQTLVVINTLRANRIVSAAISRRLIPELSDFASLRTEVRYGHNSRIDILLDQDCLVEVKSCTLAEGSLAMFPDAPTERGRKHIHELSEQIVQGRRGVLLFLIQRTDTDVFSPAAHIDPDYAAALRDASRKGLEILAYDTRISLSGVSLGNRIPISLNP